MEAGGAAEPCRGGGVVEAGLGHESCVELCGASLSTDVAAVGSIGVAVLLTAASETVHRLS